jgi:hypothetical protein
VRVGVVTDLVPRSENRFDGAGPTPSCPSRNEERRPNALLLEHSKNTRHAYTGAKSLVRHRHRVAPSGGADGEDRCFGVDVERQREGALEAVREYR